MATNGPHDLLLPSAFANSLRWVIQKERTWSRNPLGFLIFAPQDIPKQRVVLSSLARAMAGKGSQFATIWATAKAQYAAAVGEDIDDPSFPHPSSTDDLLSALEHQNKDFRHFREKRAVMFDILDGACRPIQLVGNLAAGGASMVFPPSTLCFGAVMYLINAAHGVSASYDAIADLLRTLKDFLVRLKVYDREDLADELREKLAETLATLLEIFARSTKVIKGGSGGRILQFAKNVLLGRDEKLQGLVMRLEKLCQSEHRLVGVETLTESKKTGRLVEGVSVTLTETSMAVEEGNAKINQVSVGVQQVSIGQEEMRRELQQGINNVMTAITSSEEKDEARHQKKFKAILKPSVSPLDLFDSIAKRRVPGTGDWIRDEPLFQNWTGRINPILWISGNPGSGKSFLAESMISYLKEQHPQGVQHPSHVSVGFYFFKDSDPNTRSVHQALRDVAYQISQNDPVYARHVAARCHSDEDIKTIHSTWRNLFIDFFVANEKVDSHAYIVLDGMDEAFEQEKKEFLELLSDLLEIGSNGSQFPRIQVALIGRPQISEDILDALNVVLPTIHVDSRKNNQDICSYVESSIKKSRVLNRVPKDVRAEIVNTLVDNAQGMFIWVDLMMRELTKKTRVSNIRASLHQAPKGLQEMLRHVLERFSSTLKDEEPDDLNTMLAWVTCAARPLVLDEVDVILKLRSAEGDGVLNLENMLRKQFASFFLLVRDDGLETSDLQGDRVKIYAAEDEQADNEDGLDDVENETDFNSDAWTTEVIFCHASIGDFFRNKSEGKVSAGDGYSAIGVDIMQAKLLTLKMCLKLVCGPDSFPTDTWSLRRYALYRWHEHLQNAVECLDAADQNEKVEIGTLLLKLLRDPVVIADWVENAALGFFSTENLRPLTLWLGDNLVLQGLSTEDRDWIIPKLEKPAELYLPAARLIAEKWLCGITWDHLKSMANVHCISALLDGLQVGPIVLDNAPIELILNTAEWPQLEKDALWHRRLAMCLRDCGHAPEAKEHFETALRLENRMWLARAGLAQIYVLQKDYEKAIELCKINGGILETLLAEDKERDELDPENCNSYDLAEMWNDIASAYNGLGDDANSLLYFRKAFETSNRSYEYALSYIDILDKMGHAEEVIRLMKGMQEELPNIGYTRLTECVYDNMWPGSTFFRIVAKAAKEMGELEWLVRVHQTAISIANREKRTSAAIILNMCLADIYWLYLGNAENALPIWNMIADFPAASRPGISGIGTFYKGLATRRLGTYLITNAFQAGDGTAEADRSLKRLDSMCKQKAKLVVGAPEIVTASYCALFMGLWYRVHGRYEQARSYFQPYIKEALMLLSDDDPDNDNSAYYDLAHVLLAAGDESNAMAAFNVVIPTHVQENDAAGDGGKENAEQKGTNYLGSRSFLTELMATPYVIPSESPDFAWVCDGPCERSFGNWTGANVCQYCLVDLCDDCVQSLKHGVPMRTNVCSPEHEWFHVPAPKHVAESGQIYVNDELIKLEDFKDSLRKEWEV